MTPDDARDLWLSAPKPSAQAYLAAWTHPTNLVATGVDRVRRLVGSYTKGYVVAGLWAELEDEFRRLAFTFDADDASYRILKLVASATEGVLLPQMVRGIESEAKGFVSAFKSLAQIDVAAALP